MNRALVLSLLLAGLAVAQEPPAGDAPPPAEPPPADQAAKDEPQEKQKEGKQKGEPEFSIGLFLFLPARIQGRAGVAGTDLDVDATFEDLWNNTDVGGIAGRAELWAGRVGGVLDGYYSRVELEETDVPPTPARSEVDFEYRLGILDMLAGVRPLDLELGDVIGLELDLLFGARIVDFKEEVELTTMGGQVEAGESHNWVEIAFGFRATLEVWWFYAVAGADISGFGIGSASNYIANGLLGVGFRRDVFSIELAWRVLDMDYDRGSGLEELSYDVTQSGPQLTIALHF